MAISYKNIVITPNISNTSDPKIVFSGANATVNTDITLNVYPASNGTLSFDGAAGQLFSITNDLSNSLFSVSDVSGIPSIEVFANGLVSLVPISGNVAIGNSISFTTNTTFTGAYFGNSTFYSNMDLNGVTAVDDVGGLASLAADQMYISSSGGVGQYSAITVSLLGAGGAGQNNAYLGLSSLQLGNSTIFANYTSANLSIYGGSGAIYANLSPTSFTMGNVLVANTLGIFHGGTVNAASHTVGTSFVANSTGMFVGASVHANSTAFDVGNTIISTTNAIFGGTIAANGGIGTAGQVLTSGAAANAYWATPLIKGGPIGSIDYNTERTRASGIYSVDIAPTNGPPGAAYSNYIQMYERTDTAAQIVVDYANGQLHSRGILTSTPTYSAWRTYISNAANINISGGFTVTAFNLGTGSGTVTPSGLSGNYQYITNNGAFTLAAPAADCAIDILITNGATAGAITFSGYTVGSIRGGTLTTTNAQRFLVSIRRVNAISTYSIYALQ